MIQNPVAYGIDTRWRRATTTLAAATMAASLVLGILGFKVIPDKILAISAMGLAGGSILLNFAGGTPSNWKKRPIQILIFSLLPLSIATLGALSYNGILPQLSLKISMIAAGGISLAGTLFTLYISYRESRTIKAYRGGSEIFGGPYNSKTGDSS